MRLRVLTLNAWALVPPISRDNSRRMRAIGEALEAMQLDVAAFQELWSKDSRAQLLEAAARSGLSHVWHPEQGFGGSGLAVLSRWPIAGAKLHRFELRGVAERIHEADYLGRKGFAELLLETPAGPLAFFDTHLQAAYAPREGDPHVAMRVGQVLQLAEVLRETPHPLLLAGDLNFEQHREEYRVLTGVARVSDLAALLDSREDTIVSTNAYSRVPQQGRRIDYLFARGGLEPLSVKRVLDGPIAGGDASVHYSDHAGLLGEFDLSGADFRLAAPDSEALEVARLRLEAGRAEVEERSRRERIAGGLGLGAFPASLLAAGRPALSRRRLLRTALRAGGGLAGGFGLLRLGLSELLRPEERRAFDAALARVARLGG